MPTNLLENPGFETGWSRDESHDVSISRPSQPPTIETRDNIFTPADWLTWFYHDPGTYDQPEIKDAWKHVDPRRVRNGEKGILFFTVYRRHWGGFLQRVSVEEGKSYEATVYAHAWSNHDGERFPHPHDGRWSEGAGYDEVAWAEGTQPHDTKDSQQDAKANFTFRIGIDPTGNTCPMADSVTWGDAYHIYNGYARRLSVAVTAQANEITVFLSSKTLWTYCHNDAYFDDAALMQVDDIPSQGRGQPRVQYERVYVLLPPDAGVAWTNAVVAGSWEGKRYTLGGSADDAGVGDLDVRKVIAVNPSKWPSDLRAFYEQFYPGVEYEPLLATSPAELQRKLESSVSPPSPPPPLPPAPTIILSFQQQRAAGYRDEFIAKVQPPAWLLVGGFEEAAHLKSLAPNMEIAIRHVDNAWGDYIFASDRDAAAERWIRHYGQTLFDQAGSIDYALDLNEYHATNDYAALQATPFWIEALVKRFEREGWPARLIGLNVAVGNPQHDYLCKEQGIPSQISLLTPAVRLLTSNECKIGYHAYFGVRNLGDRKYYSTLDEPESVRMHYAFRALLSWDPVFRADGVYPQYAFTEGGPIYIDEAGLMVSSGAGWKYRETFGGDVDACVASYLQFQALVQGWNIEHGKRARWMTAFIHGAYSDWVHFDMAGEPSRRLAAALVN